MTLLVEQPAEGRRLDWGVKFKPRLNSVAKIKHEAT